MGSVHAIVLDTDASVKQWKANDFFHSKLNRFYRERIFSKQLTTKNNR